MKKGIERIILGAILIILQLMSFVGNAQAGNGIQISFDSLGVFLYSIIFLVSYCFFGIMGVVLLIFGIRAYKTGEHDEPPSEERVISKEPEEHPGFTIPLSLTMPILIAIFVIILAIVLIFERA